MQSLLVRNCQLVWEAIIEKVDVLVLNGKIEKITFHDSPTYALPAVPDPPERLSRAGDPVVEVIDAEGMLLFPGLIDCHVHFREPGFLEKATMQSESRAAIAGGVTTVCEMPNTNPPTVTIAALADKVRRAEEIDDCDIRFFFGVTQVEHLNTLRDLWTGDSEEMQRLKKHCNGVKIYFDHSTGNQKIAAELTEDVFRVCGELKIPLVGHCEHAEINERCIAELRDGHVPALEGKPIPTEGWQRAALHSQLRPEQSEAAAIDHALTYAARHRTPLHIAHLSTLQGLELVRMAKRENVTVTCEVAPHHLFLSTEDYERLGTLGKMNPPLHSPDHCKALWEGIADGTVDCIATDHAPHTLEEKNALDPLDAPSGVPGVETMVPLLLSVASGNFPRSEGNPKSQISNPKLSYSDIFRLCFENPNRIFSLGKKGIAEGAPADFILVDPKKEWTIHAKDLHYKCGWTPFEGWRVRGKIANIV